MKHCLLAPSSGFQYGGYQFSRQAFVYMQRHKAIVVIVMIVEAKILLTIGVGIGIVAIKNNHRRLLPVGIYKTVDHTPANLVKLSWSNRVFQAAHGRLRCQVFTTLRQSTNAGFK